MSLTNTFTSLVKRASKTLFFKQPPVPRKGSLVEVQNVWQITFKKQKVVYECLAISHKN